MQRKLSEIAEIPKILSSTLATVSQTFEILKSTDLPQQQQQQLLQYQQNRKHSYDEDALDYELSGSAATDERLKLQKKGAKGAKGNGKSKIALTGGNVKKAYVVKDTTPESDYASEGNYESNGADTDADYDDGGGDSGSGSDVNNNRRNMRKLNVTSDGASEGAQSEGNYKRTNNYTLRTVALTGIDISDDDDAEGALYSYVTRVRPAKSCQQKQRKKQNEHHCDDGKRMSDEGGANSTSTTDNDDDDDDDDNNENTDEDAITVRFVATECESDEETDDDVDDDNDNAKNDDDDDDDFLTTTYTWNLRKIPKLQLNDEPQSFDKCNAVKDEVDMDDTDEEKPNKKARWCHGDDDSQDDEKPTQWAEDEDAKEKKFCDKLEGFFPWADREKIIYKQSTCHLVRRRPLGLVEQRIKLLAKQNLGNSLERQLHGK